MEARYVSDGFYKVYRKRLGKHEIVYRVTRHGPNRWTVTLLSYNPDTGVIVRRFVPKGPRYRAVMEAVEKLEQAG